MQPLTAAAAGCLQLCLVVHSLVAGVRVIMAQAIGAGGGVHCVDAVGLLHFVQSINAYVVLFFARSYVCFVGSYQVQYFLQFRRV